MKSFPLLFVSTVLLAARSPRAAAADTLELTPDLAGQLAAEAQANSPHLQSVDAEARAAAAAVDSVRSWEDPTASFGVSAAAARDFRAADEGNLVYGVSQKLPLYGTPDLKRRIASADASQAQFAADYESLRLRRDLTVALSDLALADREAEVARADIAWIDATLAAVDHLYRVGQASQVDWLRIQTERAVAADDLTTKETARDHSALALNRLLNRDLHARWPAIALPAQQPALFYTSSLVAAALAAEPQLKAMRQASASAQASAELTRKQRLPDVNVGVNGRQYSGDGGFREGTLTVSFSVPWLNRGRYDNDWRRDQERKRAADFAASDYALTVSEMLHHKLVDLDAARREAILYQGQLLPLTEQTLSSARTAWEHRLGPFQDILEAHRMLLSDELALARALTLQTALVADITFLTGSRDPAAVVALAGTPSAADEHLHSLSP